MRRNVMQKKSSKKVPNTGCWIPIIHDGAGKGRTVICSECDEAFRYARDVCPACGKIMNFDPRLVYARNKKETEDGKTPQAAWLDLAPLHDDG